MGIVVQKYGGSSVADAAGIKRVAQRVVATKEQGHDVVVAVSAMGDTTDELIDLANKVSPDATAHAREFDMLLTSGERQSMALLAMAINDVANERGLAYEARSFTGSQAGLITDAQHGRAKILSITPERIQAALGDGAIAIVAGFQGVSRDTKDITTLGRGGTDTTAVALAVALDADVCEIYTDVDGVFTADPRIVPTARKLSSVAFEEMLELAASGAKVLHLRSVEFARRHSLPIHVRSSFSTLNGTVVKGSIDAVSPHADHQLSGDAGMEAPIVAAIAHDRSQAKITVVNAPDEVGAAAKVFEIIAGVGINVDMVVQDSSAAGADRTDITFTLPRDDAERAGKALEQARGEVGFERVNTEPRMGKVSLIGAGLRTQPKKIADFFSAIAQAGVNIQMISTSEVRVSVVVGDDEVDRAVEAAAERFSDVEVEKVSYGADADGDTPEIVGVAHDRGEAKITVAGVTDEPGEAARIFDTLADNGINIDMIVQNVSAEKTRRTDISFTLPRTDVKRARAALGDIQAEVGFADPVADEQIGKLSIVGAGMRTHPGITAKFFAALAAEGVLIRMVSTSEIRVSVLVSADDLDRAVRATHKAFGLDSDVEAIVYGGTGR
ncbi:aspartate kinase [Nocardioides sp. NPDC004968]|uniref:aspartate kinase n=1 Tax=Nocardioides sp. NPDC004968 TaxID=3155894 RepID=UPI0033AB1C90